MTLPRAFDLMESWGTSPPVHWMIAAKLGFGGKEAKPEKVAEEADWEALAAAMGTTITRTKSDGPPE